MVPSHFQSDTSSFLEPPWPLLYCGLLIVVDSASELLLVLRDDLKWTDHSTATTFRQWCKRASTRNCFDVPKFHNQAQTSAITVIPPVILRPSYLVQRPIFSRTLSHEAINHQRIPARHDANELRLGVLQRARVSQPNLAANSSIGNLHAPASHRQYFVLHPIVVYNSGSSERSTPPILFRLVPNMHSLPL